MYLRGNKWTMTRRTRRRPSLWRIVLLLVLIGGGLYINQVVVPATPPLFIPTQTPTTSPESYVNQAQELYSEGKITQAIEAYKKAIYSNPGNPSNYVELARLQVFAGQYDEAITNTQNALLKNPNNPLAQAVQAWALGMTGKYGEAELEIKKALALDPNNALAHAYYAEILINQRDFNLYDKAAEESRIARDLNPNLFETHRARGLVLMNTDNVPEAIEEFKAALAINKNIADVHLNLGIAYQSVKEYDKAEESFLAAYALNPRDTVALTQIALSYFSNGRYRQAEQYAEEAVKVDPSDPSLHGNLGIMIYKNEEYANSTPELALAVEGGTTQDGVAVTGLPLDHGHIAEFYWFYGFALARTNNCSKAIPIFQALLTGVPDDETAVYNANAGLDLCQQMINGITSTPSPESAAQTTPTP